MREKQLDEIIDALADVMDIVATVADYCRREKDPLLHFVVTTGHGRSCLLLSSNSNPRYELPQHHPHLVFMFIAAYNV